MRSKHLAVPLLGVLALFVSACGATSTPSSLHVTQLASGASGSISLTSGWVLAPTSGGMAHMPGMSADQQMVAAYAVLDNSSAAADALTRVRAPGSAHAQLHTTIERATSGTMTDVGQITVPAHGKAELAPGGPHVMLTGLTPVPKAGDRVKLMFVFRSGAAITVALPVISAADRPGA